MFEDVAGRRRHVAASSGRRRRVAASSGRRRRVAASSGRRRRVAASCRLPPPRLPAGVAASSRRPNSVKIYTSHNVKKPTTLRRRRLSLKLIARDAEASRAISQIAHIGANSLIRETSGERSTREFPRPEASAQTSASPPTPAANLFAASGEEKAIISLYIQGRWTLPSTTDTRRIPLRRKTP